MDFPIYVIGNRAFIDSIRRALILDSVDQVEAAVDTYFGPVSVQTFDGLIGTGETPAMAFHHLVQIAEDARVADAMEKLFQPMIANDFFAPSAFDRYRRERA